jgi:hypothetical protein
LSVIKKLKANSYRLKAFVYKGLIIELRLLRAAVSGNPKPSTEESEEKKDEESKEGEKN